VRNGIHILKFFLNVSKDEQKRRFLKRIATPEKNWKFFGIHAIPPEFLLHNLRESV
jgi:polyphosphate kinase 2 (PPK2 family)